MNSVSILVASKYRDIFEDCAKPSVDSCLTQYRKFVTVDNQEWVIPGWTVLQGPMPFRGHAAILNVGISATGPDDVLWMHDDVTVLSPYLVNRLRETAYKTPNAGPVSPVMYRGVGNPLQEIGDGCSDEVIVSPTGLGFMCIYFRRDLLNEIGPMDERFTGYAPDDADWCRRAQQAGYDLLIDRSVAVRHGFGDSGFATTWRRRLGSQCFESIPEMTRLYEEKWAQA